MLDVMQEMEIDLESDELVELVLVSSGYSRAQRSLSIQTKYVIDAGSLGDLTAYKCKYGDA